MSADNWTDCPACIEMANRDYNRALVEFNSAYGNVPEKEYLALKDKVAEGPRPVESTFAEYYEIYGAEDGVVKVTYSGVCKVCGTRLEFKEEHPIDLTGLDPVW